MDRLISYVKRALELPPREAARAAQELLAARTSALRQRISQLTGPDALDDRAFARAAGVATEAERAALAARLFAHEASVLPVKWPAVATPPDTQRIRQLAAEAIAHRFDLLGSGAVRVTLDRELANRQRRRMEALLPGVTDGYEPIDWHIDFKIGHRWPDDVWFSQIEYGQRDGVDVKVPWELSRLQHTGALGLAYRFASETAEGSRAPAEFRAQVVDWIAANPAGWGVNWACPMDVALRAITWLSGMALFDDAPELTPSFRWLVAKSLYAHAHHIEKNLEYHRRQTGNHYLTNVVGLLCIGAALPELPESGRWCLYGVQELTNEMERQVLSDGVDIEGSVTYHHLVSELFYLGTLVALRLDAGRRAGLRSVVPGRMRHPYAPPLAPLSEQRFALDRAALFPPSYLARLLQMAEFARVATKPDGRVPQIGDNDNGRAYQLGTSTDPCDRRTLLAVAGRLFGNAQLAADGAALALDGELLVADTPVAAVRSAARAAQGGATVHQSEGSSLHLFEAGGVAVIRAGQLYIAISFASVPAAASGGHFHNDLLSFELQYDDVDFVVDAGTCLYTPAPALRDVFRSTAAHSTVVVDGIEQRVWPRGVGRLFAVQKDAAVRLLEAAHDRLCIEIAYGDVRHLRRWHWGRDWLRIEDSVAAPAPATLVLNLHPAVQRSLYDDELLLERAGRRVSLAIEGADGVSFADGRFSPGYGVRRPNYQVRARLAGGRMVTSFEFARALPVGAAPASAVDLGQGAR